MDSGAETPVPAKARRDKRPFTTEEDAQLVDRVAQHGDHPWHQIENALPGRSFRQSRERWSLYDDVLLMRLYSAIGPKWTLIATNFPRTANSIKNRETQILRSAQRVTRLNPSEPHLVGFDSIALAQLGLPRAATARQGAARGDLTSMRKLVFKILIRSDYSLQN
jgi:hypothetical protein